jgi:hypothetical protein
MVTLSHEPKFYDDLDKQIVFASKKAQHTYKRCRKRLNFGRDPTQGKGPPREFRSWTQENGRKIQGEYCKETKRWEGRILHIWNNGGFLMGYLSAGKITGTACYVHGNGNFYKGQFVNDLKHGFGTLWMFNGEKYRGYFRFGKMHGGGLYKWPDGSMYEGSWFEGKRMINGTHYESKGKANKSWYD